MGSSYLLKVCGKMLQVLLILHGLTFLAASDSSDQGNTCLTPHLSLTGDRFVTIRQGQEVTLSCDTTMPIENVVMSWYLQFKNITDPLRLLTAQRHYPEISFRVEQEGIRHNLILIGLTSWLERVLVQCTVQSGGEPERFSKGMFLVHILPPDDTNVTDTTVSEDECTNSTVPEGTHGTSSKQTEESERLIELTFLTTAMSGCLIINTVTLLMVVMVLCRIRRRDSHAQPRPNQQK